MAWMAHAHVATAEGFAVAPYLRRVVQSCRRPTRDRHLVCVRPDVLIYLFHSCLHSPFRGGDSLSVSFSLNVRSKGGRQETLTKRGHPSPSFAAVVLLISSESGFKSRF